VPSGEVKNPLWPGPYTPFASLRWNTGVDLFAHEEALSGSPPL
jgi:hypothetical protein